MMRVAVVRGEVVVGRVVREGRRGDGRVRGGRGDAQKPPVT